MTNPDYRHYILIIDRSGSMKLIQADAQGGIRQFITDQAAIPGRATISLYEFDNTHEIVHDFADLHATAADYTLVPRGMTALRDTCVHVVTREGEKLAALPEHERPGKVIVLIATDGEDTYSRECTAEQVKELFTQQQEQYGWQFSYIGANVDAFSAAGAMGIPTASALNYAATRGGTRGAYAAASASVSRFVKGKSASVTYTDDERREAAD